jgi:hemerythrin
VDIANDRFQRAVHEVADYARYHFGTEEKLMSILEYPDFYDHKREHGEFIWEIISRSKEFQGGDEFLPEKFVLFIGEWIRNHIGIYDKAFSEYFGSMKHHGKLKLILGGRQILSSNLA